jgi:plasmid segregation protein ParM
MKKSVIRALELGFGTSSLTKSVENGIPEIVTFFSLVAQVDPSMSGLNAGMNKRDTVTIEIAGAHYEVGPDAGLAAGKKTSRVLNSSYVNSAQYQALLFGSLVMMGEKVIDMLVLGLPVENWSRREELKLLVVGKHTINGQDYTVNDVWIIVQPMGGLFAHSNTIGQEAYNELRQMNILSVDPGYGTFDFCMSFGLKLNESLSGGSSDHGMSAVLESVSQRLTLAFGGMSDIPIERIDEAFWKNKNFIRIAGRKYPFPICSGKDMDDNEVDIHFNVKNSISDVTRSAITKLVNKVGNGGDVDVILLMGGSWEVYLPALKEAYPAHNIIILKEPIRSVCLGMYFGGVQYYALKQKQTTEKPVKRVA